MISRFRLIAVTSSLFWVAGCGTDPNSGAPCPDVNGEFGPTHCAYVEGRVTRAGVPVAGAGIRVDEYLSNVGYEYVSSPTGVDANGRFGLVVFRMNQLQPQSGGPDTARILVKLYASETAAQPGAAAADDSLLVLMTFAPMGTPVDTTAADLTLP